MIPVLKLPEKTEAKLKPCIAVCKKFDTIAATKAGSYSFTTKSPHSFKEKYPLKLLLIEDEQNLRETIEKYFSEEGSICESCGDLKTAIDKLAMYDYDCVLLDIGLPDGNGFAALEYLKANQKSEGVLIISARNSL